MKMLKRLADWCALDSDLVVENGASEIVMPRSKTGRQQTTSASPTEVRPDAKIDSNQMVRAIRRNVAAQRREAEDRSDP